MGSVFVEELEHGIRRTMISYTPEIFKPQLLVEMGKILAVGFPPKHLGDGADLCPYPLGHPRAGNDNPLVDFLFSLHVCFQDLLFNELCPPLYSLGAACVPLAGLHISDHVQSVGPKSVFVIHSTGCEASAVFFLLPPSYVENPRDVPCQGAL